jgi:hypothetical protein
LAEKDWRTHALGANDASQHDRELVSRYFFSHTGRLRIVDKNNQNGLCVSFLHALFPGAQFVYIKRGPGDNIHSLIEGWGKAEEFATWSRPPLWRSVVAMLVFFCSTAGSDTSIRPSRRRSAVRIMNRAIIDASKSCTMDRDPLRPGQRPGCRAFESCGLEFTPDLKKHCAGVLSTPYNAFSEIRLDKWRDQGNREVIERILPSLRGLAGEMGYQV